eukprot:g7426.t1
MSMKVRDSLIQRGIEKWNGSIVEWQRLQTFTCSTGFAQKFLRRCAGNNGKSVKLHGEAGGLDFSKKTKLANMMNGATAEDVVDGFTHMNIDSEDESEF